MKHQLCPQRATIRPVTMMLAMASGNRNFQPKRISCHQVNKKGNELRKDVPLGYVPEPCSALRIYDGAQTETAGENQYAYKRKPKRQFVTNHLGAGAQRSEQSVFAVGRPSCQRDS